MARLVQWLLVLMLPLLLSVANFRITNGHRFVRFEYGKAGFPPDDCCEDTLTAEERT